LRIVEVPSVEKPRLHGESKLNAVRDGLRILRVILTELRTGVPYAADPAQAPEAADGHWEPADVSDVDPHRAPVGQLDPEALADGRDSEVA
jgi:hypothetical protein